MPSGSAAPSGRVQRLLDRHGISLDGDSEGTDALAETSPILAACSAASIQGQSIFGRHPGAPVHHMGRDPDPAWVTSRGPRHAHVNGFESSAPLSPDPSGAWPF
ncbi:MAG TPA: hypothetical protein VGK30_01175 [Candidatus Binatia bacterium]|jgi:hypothetical protein